MSSERWALLADPHFTDCGELHVKCLSTTNLTAEAVRHVCVLHLQLQSLPCPQRQCNASGVQSQLAQEKAPEVEVVCTASHVSA